MGDNRKVNVDKIEGLYKDGVISLQEYQKMISRVQNMTNNNKTSVYSMYKEFKTYLKDEYSQNTASGYATSVKNFIEYIFNVEDVKQVDKDTVLPSLSGQDIQQWFNKLLGNGYSATSIKRYKHSIKNFFDFISARYCISVPEIDGLDIPKDEKDADVDILSDKEIRNIACHATNVRDKSMIMLMYEAGLRRQELIDAKKQHIDFEKRTIYIYDGDKLDRVGYFGLLTKSLLEQYMKEWEQDVQDINDKRRQNALEKRERYNLVEISDYIFQTVRSPQMSYATVFKALKDASYEYYLNLFINEGLIEKEARKMAEEKANIVNTETLRHSRRAFYFSEGKSVEQVQMLMGDENWWVCKRYLKLAQKIYPDKFQ